MNIIVCIKQVPDTNDIKIDKEKGTLKREGVPSIMNPDDKHALIEAVKLKGDGNVTVVSMGPPQAEEVLREALAYGADEAFLLTDRLFAAADTMATSYTIAKAIEKIGKFDLIFCGRQAIDGDTAQIGPQVAENLGIPQITYVQKIEVKDGSVEVERQTEYGHDVVSAKMPVLLTAVKELNQPDYPTLKGILSAYRN
ncbi:electron transfer flavoprotein subunit beta/FixA family protein, partial [Nanoarchaeota archaeon]